jgi:nitrogenase molybdenum-iron protein alpha/beta subunit
MEKGDLKGTLLGIDQTVRALSALGDTSQKFSIDQVEREALAAKEEMARVCDKYLQRHDPPSVGIFGGTAYACFAARLLEEVLDASITCIGSRNPASLPSSRLCEGTTLDQVRDLIGKDRPDLILGSSFEHSLAPGTAYVPFTFPVRGMVRLRARPLVGIQGTLGLIEDVLNALLDR